MDNPRVPPVPPSQLDAEKKEFHDQAALMAEKAFGDVFTWKNADGALIGPFAMMMNAPTPFARAFLEYSATLSSHKGLPTSSREVAILVVVARHRSAYPTYAHVLAGEKMAGLSRETVAQLVRGEEPTGLSTADRVAYDVATALGGKGPMSKALWDRAVACFGKEGAIGLVNYCGAYTAVAVIMNGFDVPVPEGESAGPAVV